MNSYCLKCKKNTESKNLHFFVCFYHATYALQIESTHYSCLNVKELLGRSRRNI